MGTKDFYTDYYARECSGNGSEIPTVPHTLESPFKDRLISKRGAICSCAAAVACMGSGIGFGTLIPADQTPQIVQLQKELENKNKKINELIELTFEDDEDSTVLNKLSEDNETRKGMIVTQNESILNLQGERTSLTLQIDTQLQKIKGLEEKNKGLTEENKELYSDLRRMSGEGIKKFLDKLCKSGKGIGIGRKHNSSYNSRTCSKLVDEIGN